MITRFFLNEKARLGKALELLITALEKYNARDFDTDEALKAALDEAIAACRELGKSSSESQFQALKAEWITAQRGINPATMEKVTIRRNEMTGAVKFSVMQKAQQQLRADADDTDATLKEATMLLSQILVAAMQSGLISQVDIDKVENDTDAEALWKLIGKDENIGLGQSRVLLLISRFDALLIFGDLLHRLKQN